MWKESYRIGVESIDRQHMELFRMTDELLKAIEENAGSAKYQEAINFLKDYVVFHFSDEEEYQASIGYEGLRKHQKIHRLFTDYVLDTEKRLKESGYDIGIVKELAGTLTAWLIYHVAKEDQMIVKSEAEIEIMESQESYIDVFTGNLFHVLEAMAGLNAAKMKDQISQTDWIDGDIFVKIDITGSKEGCVLFGFTEELACKLFEIMTFMSTVKVDGMVLSALSEVANIACGNAMTALNGAGGRFDIGTPEVFTKDQRPEEETGGLRIETGIGGLQVALRLE